MKKMLPLLALGLLTASAAGAEPQLLADPLATPATVATIDVGDVAPLAVPPLTASEGAALSLEEMSDISAGDGTFVEALTSQQLTGASTGNSVVANSVTSGDVNFSPTALSGFSGVGNFVVNTGANNTLQGAINISVVTVPTP
ncbi:hypothetical protein [Phenylobacterium deserti]|uniref:Uncharacterized protein n=1 Tax=Phenylobacterium deserti TaxID=1914756 RepID=A0A328ASW7_9CAUL|nr:hypothetical protein [Phenylobacterium deserti]RAK57639.1 hypothetical protein DJ018_06855 [Phenylobacterium deserti]